jgi:hypothetical protein
MSYEADGKMGTPIKGTYTLLGGTGKCTGITGSGEFVRTYLNPDIAWPYFEGG